MTLDTSGLTSGIQSVASAPPSTSSGCAQAWADAIGDYASAIVPPSTTVSAATSTLSSALATAFASPAAAAGMETAFSAFAVTVGTGMAPGFTATPPAGSVGFAALFAGAFPSTHAAAATALVGIVDSWMRSGTATPSGGGPPVSWS